MKVFQDLILINVQGQRKNEVRLKIHPSGKCIQWIECGCSKNRAKGVFCEHIIAAAVFIDREKPQFFKYLDSQAPLRFTLPTRTRNKLTKDPSLAEKGNLILNQALANIEKVSLIKSGPNLEIKSYLKASQVDTFVLNIDQSGEFLKEHNALDKGVLKSKIKTYTMKAIPTIVLSLDKQDDIECTRAMAFKIDDKSEALFKSKKSFSSQIQELIDDSTKSPKDKKPLHEYFVVKLERKIQYLGEKYFFISGLGYFPVDWSQCKANTWGDLPFRQKFKDDEAADLLRTGFKQITDIAPILKSEAISELHVADSLTIADIKMPTKEQNSEESHWTHLDPIYQTGDIQISMVDLIKSYQRTGKKYIKKNKHWIKIPEFVRENEWSIASDSENLQLSTLELFRLNAALGSFDNLAASKSILNKIRQKIEFDDNIETPELDKTKLSLRNYQKEGYAWLWWLYKNNLNGLLADEMGLGKTHQAMALLSAMQSEKKEFKFLVICPTTVIDHWYDKCEEFSPNLNPSIYHGASRETNLIKNPKAITLITSYGILLRDNNLFKATHWDAIVLDEAHYIKNNKTATYLAICSIPSRTRLALTGTPIENNLYELKNIFDFLLPGYLGSDKYFKKKFIVQELTEKDSAKQENQEASPEVKGGKIQNLSLQKLVYPFKLRRVKSQVLTDLPDKVEDMMNCHLSEEQSAMYMEIVKFKANTIVSKLKNEDEKVPMMHVFSIINLLKQLCDHPALIKKDKHYSKMESGKFELFKDLIAQAVDNNNKVVVYSQYLGMIDIICDHLTQNNIQHVSLTGSTRNRGEVIAKFQNNPSCHVFVGSLLAGGIGIDLTSASVVIHYDRWWNPSKENQATDRVHRIGQKNSVQVYKLNTKGTLEDKINTIINKKKGIFETFIEKDEEIFKSLSRQEMIELLT